MKKFLIAVAIAGLVIWGGGGPIASAEGMPQCIHVETSDGQIDFMCGRGEPGFHGAPPAVYIDGENVSGG